MDCRGSVEWGAVSPTSDLASIERLRWLKSLPLMLKRAGCTAIHGELGTMS